MFQNTHAELLRLLAAFYLLGAALGCFFDLFRIARVALRGLPKRLLFFLHFFGDLLFFGSAAGITSLAGYLLNRGRIRADLLLFEALGFLFYYLTIGRLVFALAEKIVSLCRAGLRFLYLHTFIPYRRMLAGAAARIRSAVTYRRLCRRSRILSIDIRESLSAAFLPPDAEKKG